MENKLTTHSLEQLDSNFFNKEVSDLVKELNFLVKKYKEKGFTELSIYSVSNYGELEGFNLSGSRLETNEEVVIRKTKAEKQKVANDKRTKKLTTKEIEYKTYLELKEKFETGK